MDVKDRADLNSIKRSFGIAPQYLEGQVPASLQIRLAQAEIGERTGFGDCGAHLLRRVSVELSVLALTRFLAPISIKLSIVMIRVRAGSVGIGRAGLPIKVLTAVPLLPREDVRGPLVLTVAPSAVLVTSKLIVQLAPAATDPLKEKELAPGVAFPMPPQLVAAPAGSAITTPAGKVSVNARLVAASVLPVLLIA